FAYANLERATLVGANLGWANLSKANLEKANLSEANLSGANLDDTRLHGANLAGAFLFGARVSLKSLSTAKTLANATMPDGTKYEDWIRRQSGEYVPPAASSSSQYGVAESPLDYTPTPEEI
ncbi:MAG TPA: pentapeptide repeat-containing protein, partial [Promineifilum sp.]|nr:pentapeptide repeat-containing protein [Promineifilum sp.]